MTQEEYDTLERIVSDNLFNNDEKEWVMKDVREQLYRPPQVAKLFQPPQRQ